MKNLFTLAFIVLHSIILHAQNHCLSFDGTDDYVATNLTRNDLGNTYSIEFWYSYDGLTTDGYRAIIGSIDGGSGTEFFIGKNSGNTDLGIQDGNYESNAISGTDMFNGDWYHIAFTYDSGTGKVYLNGKLYNTLSFTGANTSEEILIAYEAEGSGYYFKGNIDELRFWNDVRTETEIRQNMYRELSDPASESNLIAYYQFDETSGTTATDSKNSNDGTLTNMAGSEWTVSPAHYTVGNCIDINGSQYGTIPGNAAYTNSNFTVEFWMQMDAPSTSWGGIMDNGRDNNSNFYFLTVANAWCLIFGVGSGSGVAEIWKSVDDKWHHVAGVYDGTSMHLYFDGVLDQSRTASLGTSVRDIIIGKRDIYSQYYNGKIDEIRIWSDVRTAEEIRNNMFRKLSGTEANLEAYFPLDDLSITDLADFSSTSNDASLNSGSIVDSEAYNLWLNTSSTSWSTAENWSREAIPVSNDNIGILNLSAEPSIASSPTVNMLYIADETSISLSSSLTVNNHLLLDENLDLNGQSIDLSSSGFLSEMNGMLTGSSGNITTTRTLSNIDENVAGLGAHITTTANMGSTSITRYVGGCSIEGNSSICRYYDISPTNNSGLNATLTLNYYDCEMMGNTEADLGLMRSTDLGTSWSEVGGTINTTDNTITISAVDAFSRWTAMSGEAALPVEWLEFNIVCIDDKGSEFHWTTASEHNNKYFEIQQSIDAEHFETIKRVNGKGNSNTTSQYIQTYPSDIQNGKYFRLKQVDYNGQFSYSETIKNPCFSESFKVNFYPNPIHKDNLNVCLNSEEDINSYQIKIYNSEGLLQTTEVFDNGHIKRISTNHWHPGIYLIKITSPNQTLYGKVLKP